MIDKNVPKSVSGVKNNNGKMIYTGTVLVLYGTRRLCANNPYRHSKVFPSFRFFFIGCQVGNCSVLKYFLQHVISQTLLSISRTVIEHLYGNTRLCTPMMVIRVYFLVTSILFDLYSLIGLRGLARLKNHEESCIERWLG